VEKIHLTFFSFSSRLIALSPLTYFCFTLAHCDCRLYIAGGYCGRRRRAQITFRDVVLATRDHAFGVSPYPVILSLENHCSEPFQVCECARAAERELHTNGQRTSMCNRVEAKGECRGDLYRTFY
jgi:hypothetical protein